MYATTRHRLRNLSLPAAMTVLIFSAHTIPVQGADVTISASESHVRVGETVDIIIEARRDEKAGMRFGAAQLRAGSNWTPGGQTVGSERFQRGAVLKTWRFDLTAVAAGTTQVVPVVYLELLPVAAGERDSLIGEAATIIIDPPPGPARWPWIVALVAVVTALWTAVRAFRRRLTHSRRQEILPPLPEALGLLDQADANCREDRAQQYFADVAAVICGYFARRLDRALPSLTAREVRPLISPHVSDDGALGEIEKILRRCGEVRFGSGRAPFAKLQATAARVRLALEQLDRAWVTDTRKDGPRGAPPHESYGPE